MNTNPQTPATQTPLTERNLLTPYPDGRMGRPSPEEIEAGDTFVSSALCAEMELRLSVAELALAASKLREAELVKALEEARPSKELWAKLMLKADMFDYLCWLQGMHSPEQLHGVQQLCIASDNTTCWADTYADAVRVAMEHDKEIFDAMNNPAPPTNSKEMNK